MCCCVSWHICWNSSSPMKEPSNTMLVKYIPHAVASKSFSNRSCFCKLIVEFSLNRCIGANFFSEFEGVTSTTLSFTAYSCGEATPVAIRKGALSFLGEDHANGYASQSVRARESIIQLAVCWLTTTHRQAFFGIFCYSFQETIKYS